MMCAADWWASLSWQAVLCIVLTPAALLSVYCGTRPQKRKYDEPLCSPKISRAWIRAWQDQK